MGFEIFHEIDNVCKELIGFKKLLETLRDFKIFWKIL